MYEDKKPLKIFENYGGSV